MFYCQAKAKLITLKPVEFQTSNWETGGGTKEQEVFLLVWKGIMVQQACQNNGINEATADLITGS